MAGYQGRKGPNVSHYLANLNALPSSTHDVVVDDDFNIDKELAQFTNTEFLDFDTGGFLEQSVPEYIPDGKGDGDDAKGLDFGNGAFPSFDLDSFLPQDTQPSLQTPQPLLSPLYTTSTSPLTFAQSPFPTQPQPHLPSPISTTTTVTPPSAPSTHETPTSHLAAEEDKRRRNTAASARFRVKKKQREQALEHTAKELENKTSALERRIGQLETENEWLRGLVVEKHGGVKEDLRGRWRGEGEGELESSGWGGKKGVGTGGAEGGVEGGS